MLDQRINQKFREPRENHIDNRRQLSDRPPPVQVARFLQVQKKIKARGNEWNKDSPVWGNRQYLSDIYNEMKRKYLKEQQRFSTCLYTIGRNQETLRSWWRISKVWSLIGWMSIQINKLTGSRTEMSSITGPIGTCSAILTFATDCVVVEARSGSKYFPFWNPS